MKELITMAFHQVRGIREIYLPEECSPMILNIVGNLREVLSVHNTDYILVEGETGLFYLRFFKDEWVGVTTEKDVNDVLIKAALERAVRFLEKHHQIELRMKHIQRDIEEYFMSIGVSATVRKVNLSVGSDSVSGEIQLSYRGGRMEAVKDVLRQFLEKQLPYFIKDKIDITVERESLLTRISREQLLKIIRRVEKL